MLTCANCRFFETFDSVYGLCRRYPPFGNSPEIDIPVVKPVDPACGEFKAIEDWKSTLRKWLGIKID